MPHSDLSRRDFLRTSATAATALALGPSLRAQPATTAPIPARAGGVKTRSAADDAKLLPGAQRLSVPALQQWEAMKFGMFIHFGMSTYINAELPSGADPSTTYAPDKLDVDQWISIARDAGMKYAVLTTKHVAGHCLWPTRHNDYHVGTSGNKTDVVAAFVKACERRGVKPGFYYCSWDNHNRFGSLSPNVAPLGFARTGPPVNRSSAYVTQAYLDFQWAQITELMDHYGPVAEWWLDIPHLLPRDYRNRLYAHIAARQPAALILYNHGIGDGSELFVDRAWPTDLIPIERFLPNSGTGHVKWRNIDGQNFYLPGEVCDPIGSDWFYTERDQPRSDAELLGMYLTSTSRGANLLLDVGPDKHGLIPERYATALTRLHRNIDRLGF
ncbi:MAG: alpha-L-fucosidase [Verrucomicrobia bacterium]|nr:alpha-L-fucosidase [Verrucomicrobiota bacterium]